ncbi:MAG: 3-hydroxy-5-phosphonooxypentane-2,4-dione thiolase [Candidatus Omnitrophota bacterium]
MDWGLENRLSKLIQLDGRCFFMPIDHGYFQGPTRSLEKPADTIKPLFPYYDALFVTRGVLRSCIDPANSKPIILRVSGGTSMVGKDLANESITTSIEEILRLNVSAVGISVFIGSDYERQTLDNLAKLVNVCENYGIPVMAVTAVGKELEKRDARYLGLCCRIAAELGARVVKTYWCEKDFDKVVSGCPVPVVMAGGPKCKTESEVFKFVYDGLEKGAIGINLGRNVWQSPYPAAMAKALRAIVHEDATVKQAEDIFNSAKNLKTACV